MSLSSICIFSPDDQVKAKAAAWSAHKAIGREPLMLVDEDRLLRNPGDPKECDPICWMFMALSWAMDVAFYGGHSHVLFFDADTYILKIPELKPGITGGSDASRITGCFLLIEAAVIPKLFPLERYRGLWKDGYGASLMFRSPTSGCKNTAFIRFRFPVGKSTKKACRALCRRAFLKGIAFRLAASR
jgi:hypothetical protein